MGRPRPKIILRAPAPEDLVGETWFVERVADALQYLLSLEKHHVERGRDLEDGKSGDQEVETEQGRAAPNDAGCSCLQGLRRYHCPPSSKKT